MSSLNSSRHLSALVPTFHGLHGDLLMNIVYPFFFSENEYRVQGLNSTFYDCSSVGLDPIFQCDGQQEMLSMCLIASSAKL